MLKHFKGIKGKFLNVKFHCVLLKNVLWAN